MYKADCRGNCAGKNAPLQRKRYSIKNTKGLIGIFEKKGFSNKYVLNE